MASAVLLLIGGGALASFAPSEAPQGAAVAGPAAMYLGTLGAIRLVGKATPGRLRTTPNRWAGIAAVTSYLAIETVYILLSAMHGNRSLALVGLGSGLVGFMIIGASLCILAPQWAEPMAFRGLRGPDLSGGGVVARVEVRREAGWVRDSLGAYVVRADGTPTVVLYEGDVETILVPPGQHTIQVTAAPSLLASRKLRINVDADATIRLACRPSTGIGLTAVFSSLVFWRFIHLALDANSD